MTDVAGVFALGLIKASEQLDAALARIAELEAALADAIKRAEAAEKDAERYRWIRDQCTWGDIYIAIGRDGLMTPGHIICGAADRAIDAAIAKEGKR